MLIHKIFKLMRRTEGAVAAMTAIGLVAATGFIAVSIDLGHLYVAKNELQRAADAGALAAAKGLLAIPPGTTGPVEINPDCGRALSFSRKVVQDNHTDGATLALVDSDVIFGKWDATARSFDAVGCSNPNQVNAIKVITRKDSTANSPVLFDFSGMMSGGIRSQDLTASSVALTGYAGHAPEGARAFPLAVDADKVPPDNTPFQIHLNPTPGDEGCWHSYKDSSSSTSNTRDYIDGTLPSPALQVGDQINVKEGVADSALKEVAKQFTLLANQGKTYDVLVPVIPADSSHSGWQPIEGFATLRITDVNAHGEDKYVQGYVVPNYIAPGVEPGGPNFGTLAGIPKMVQ
ncbi:MAG: pilus assembly protein TadG-related protein [Syntrophales bacterium]|nr:pilus assembly protein TadG-related protein [Syntrophales bacterium]MDD5640455.1 pilus assembly protein TadG-related protein [Syntrophales bacterium]